MEQELKTAKKAWEIKKDFNRQPVPSVWKYHQEWCGKFPNETRYLSVIKEYILERENIPEELHRQLETEIYLANQQEDEENDRIEAEQMKKNGFFPLTELTEYRGKIQLRAKFQGAFSVTDIEKECKIITSGNEKPFVVPKGKRSRGWNVRDLDNAFYKPIN